MPRRSTEKKTRCAATKMQANNSPCIRVESKCFFSLRSFSYTLNPSDEKKEKEKGYNQKYKGKSFLRSFSY